MLVDIQPKYRIDFGWEVFDVLGMMYFGLDHIEAVRLPLRNTE